MGAVRNRFLKTEALSVEQCVLFGMYRSNAVVLMHEVACLVTGRSTRGRTIVAHGNESMVQRSYNHAACSESVARAPPSYHT